jgi:hypothetical protein
MQILTISSKTRALTRVASALATVGALAGCASTISSQALVKPSSSLAAQATRLSPDATSASTNLHLVYGYQTQNGEVPCAASTSSTAHDGPLEHYGVTVCEQQTPLASANYVADAGGHAGQPSAAMRQRLARIAEESLQPAPPVVSEP